MSDDVGFSTAWYDWAEFAQQVVDDHKDYSVQYQVVALGVKNNRVFGCGVNQRRHAKNLSFFYDSLHAEADLIKKYGDKIQGAKVFLYRFNTSPVSPFANVPMCAKPCLLCSHMLREAKVNRVVFINKNSEVETIKNSQLAILTEDPSILTRLFLDRVGPDKHGKFIATNYLV